jgi:helix-turn-helix protein
MGWALSSKTEWALPFSKLSAFSKDIVRVMGRRKRTWKIKRFEKDAILE